MLQAKFNLTHTIKNIESNQRFWWKFNQLNVNIASFRQYGDTQVKFKKVVLPWSNYVVNGMCAVKKGLSKWYLKYYIAWASMFG